MDGAEGDEGKMKKIYLFFHPSDALMLAGSVSSALNKKLRIRKFPMDGLCLG